MFYLSLLEPSFFNVNKALELLFYFKRSGYGNVDEIVLFRFITDV